MANINQPMFILRDDTDRFQGRTALRMNIMASQILAGIVRTTLGPKGMDKMLVDKMGDVVVTNDGVTILQEMDIAHPAAKMLVEVAKKQENIVGDGTTSAVIVAGELLKQAQKLIEEYTPGSKASVFMTHPWATIIVLVLTSIVDVIAWAIASTIRSGSLFGFESKFPTVWVIIGLAITAFVEGRYISKAVKERDNCRAIVQENAKRMKQIEQEYNNTLQEFERIQQYYEDII